MHPAGGSTPPRQPRQTQRVPPPPSTPPLPPPPPARAGRALVGPVNVGVVPRRPAPNEMLSVLEEGPDGLRISRGVILWSTAPADRAVRHSLPELGHANIDLILSSEVFWSGVLDVKALEHDPSTLVLRQAYRVLMSPHFAIDTGPHTVSYQLPARGEFPRDGHIPGSEQKERIYAVALSDKLKAQTCVAWSIVHPNHGKAAFVLVPPSWLPNRDSDLRSTTQVARTEAAFNIILGQKNSSPTQKRTETSAKGLIWDADDFQRLFGAHHTETMCDTLVALTKYWAVGTFHRVSFDHSGASRNVIPVSLPETRDRRRHLTLSFPMSDIRVLAMAFDCWDLRRAGVRAGAVNSFRLVPRTKDSEKRVARPPLAPVQQQPTQQQVMIQRRRQQQQMVARRQEIERRMQQARGLQQQQQPGVQQVPVPVPVPLPIQSHHHHHQSQVGRSRIPDTQSPASSIVSASTSTQEIFDPTVTNPESTTDPGSLLLPGTDVIQQEEEEEGEYFHPPPHQHQQQQIAVPLPPPPVVPHNPHLLPIDEDEPYFFGEFGTESPVMPIQDQFDLGGIESPMDPSVLQGMMRGGGGGDGDAMDPMDVGAFGEVEGHDPHFLNMQLGQVQQQVGFKRGRDDGSGGGFGEVQKMDDEGAMNDGTAPPASQRRKRGN